MIKQRTRDGRKDAAGSSGTEGGPLYFLSENAPLRKFLKRHAHKLWWVHTSYALALGVFVVLFAQKGFAHARWLMASLGAVWLLIVLFFRFFGSGEREQRFATAESGARLRFLVMTYVMKNLYQGMLFFLLPFYWKSATIDSPNIGFVALLGVCAIVSTLDLVFDNVLMRSKVVASIFYSVTLFGCMNLVLPAIVPDIRTIYALMTAAAVTAVAFWMIHMPAAALKSKLLVALLVVCVGAGVGAGYAARTLIPPVPMHLAKGAVGPQVLADGRLAMEVKSLHGSVIKQLMAVTDVVVPGGVGDRLHHVWRHDGSVVQTYAQETTRVTGPQGLVRLRSGLVEKELPKKLGGLWMIDVETQDGQLVGRVTFTVTE
ncbi:MAG: DUF2914 domain-containing protein [Deltaproteobacteria bacterium]|nr:DUF2914 domain-containing protein [Deltaproteobacteria bacterium]